MKIYFEHKLSSGRALRISEGPTPRGVRIELLNADGTVAEACPNTEAHYGYTLLTFDLTSAERWELYCDHTVICARLAARDPGYKALLEN